MANNLKDDITHIKEWMKKEPQLPEPFEDDVILLFLHCTYYSLAQTKQCIDRFCTSRHGMSQVYLQRDPMSPSIKTAEALDDSAYYTSGDVDVFYFKLGDDVNKFVLYDSIKAVSLKIDYFIKAEHPLAERHAVALDVKEVTIKHLPKLNPVLLKDFIIYLLEAMPVRIKKIFLFNAPPITEMFYNIIKPVLSADVIEIIEICPDDKCLRKYLDEKSIPSDYGGKAKSLRERSDELSDGVLKYRTMFLDDGLWKGDATKILKKPEVNTMNGSFRSLAID